MNRLALVACAAGCSLGAASRQPTTGHRCLYDRSAPITDTVVATIAGGILAGISYSTAVHHTDSFSGVAGIVISSAFVVPFGLSAVYGFTAETCRP